MQKGFAPILVVLLIALGIGGYLIYTNYSNNQAKTPVQNTVDETTNWKVYTNTKAGFEIRYPERYTEPYTLKGTQGGGRKVTSEEDDLGIIWGDTSTGVFNIELYPFDGSVEELQQEGRTGSTLGGTETEVVVKELTVGSQKAIWTRVTSDVSTDELHKIYFTGNQHGFIFSTTKVRSDDIPMRILSDAEISQILSTFKFTNLNISNIDSKSCNQTIIQDSNKLKLACEKFLLTIPNNWKYELIEDGSLIIRSSDYTQSNDVYNKATKGAYLRFFTPDPAGQLYTGKNRENLTIDGNRALMIPAGEDAMSFESVQILLKESELYVIEVKYQGDVAKTLAYQVINSLKFNK